MSCHLLCEENSSLLLWSRTSWRLRWGRRVSSFLFTSTCWSKGQYESTWSHRIQTKDVLHLFKTRHRLQRTAQPVGHVEFYLECSKPAGGATQLNRFGCSGCRPLLSTISVCSYVATAAALDQETRGGVRKFEVCDNVDLEMMLLEFETYHYIKFQKYPKVIRKVTAGIKTPRLQSCRFPGLQF